MGGPRGQSGILDPDAELRGVRGGSHAFYQENTHARLERGGLEKVAISPKSAILKGTY
jgi:hypothetical protein